MLRKVSRIQVVLTRNVDGIVSLSTIPRSTTDTICWLIPMVSTSCPSPTCQLNVIADGARTALAILILKICFEMFIYMTVSMATMKETVLL